VPAVVVRKGKVEREKRAGASPALTESQERRRRRERCRRPPRPRLSIKPRDRVVETSGTALTVRLSMARFEAVLLKLRESNKTPPVESLPW